MSDSLFNSSSKSTAYKTIFGSSKDTQKLGVGKEEFLARRRLFLEKAQNENNIKNSARSTTPKPRSFKKPEQNLNSTKTYSKPTYSSNATTSSTKASSTKKVYSTAYTKIPDNLPKTTGLAGISSPKSNSLKSILTQMNRGNQYVSTDEFRSRRKAFEDAQLNDITQLLPRPLTPSGYTYYGRSSPLLGSDRPWSPASERPWSPAYERRGSPTPSFDSERSFGTSEVRLPWERPSQTKKTAVNATKNLVNEEKKLFTSPAVPASPTLSATAITSEEPIAIPITNDSTIVSTKDDLLNEKLQMWYSKVDEELDKKDNNNIEVIITKTEE